MDSIGSPSSRHSIHRYMPFSTVANGDTDTCNYLATVALLSTELIRKILATTNQTGFARVWRNSKIGFFVHLEKRTI